MLKKKQMQDIKKQFLNAVYLKYKKPFSHQERQISLLAGDGGTVVIQALLYKSTSKIAFRKALEINISLLCRDIQRNTYNKYPTFCNGLAGFGWLLIYLQNIQLLDIDQHSFFEDIDNYLSEKFDEKLGQGDWDILHGALGICLFFLKRGKDVYAEKAINYLKKHKIQFDNAFVWPRLDQRTEDEYYYDFGLAHGNVSIIYFLTKCYECNILPTECLALISGCLNLYFNNIQDEKSVGSYFGNLIAVEKYPSEIAGDFSRLAWCYGDLGILFTLYKTCMKTSRFAEMNQLEAMLIATTKRRSYKETQVKDAGICHGTTGVSIIYRCLHEYTGKKVFLEAYLFWQEMTLKVIAGEQDMFDYIREQYVKFKMEDSPIDLLDGLAGMSLLFITDDLKNAPDKSNIQEWKEMFFLD
jgi:hypothetical protein